MNVAEVARIFEREAKRDPRQAAADMQFLSEGVRNCILEQMRLHAGNPDSPARLKVDRDRHGHLLAIHYIPDYLEAAAA